MRICAYSECKKPFDPKTHNQCYCGNECCRKATNARIMEQYYENKDRRNGVKRLCATQECGTKLSRYNEGRICQKCQAEQESANRRNLFALVGIAA